MIQPATFNAKNLQKVKEIEYFAYRDTPYMQMQDCEDWNDVAEYCECPLNKVWLYLSTDWYVLLAEHNDYIEFVDLASKQNHTPLLQVLEIVKQFKKPFSMSCRETTSYRMIQSLEHSGRLILQKDTPRFWGNEIFHDIKAELIPKRTITMQR